MTNKTASAKDDILGTIRNSLGNKPLSDEKRLELEARLKSPQQGIIPKRSQVSGEDLVKLFTEMAQSVQSTVVRLSGLQDVPDAISDYLAAHNLPSSLKAADHDILNKIDWQMRPALTISKGVSSGDDLVSLSMAYAGIGETGSLMMVSGPDGPTTLNFLPESHLVILNKSDLVGAYEEAWNLLRLRQKASGGDLPRTVNLITGPSRTGDIEQTILLGAHGPHRLHIMLIDDD